MISPIVTAQTSVPMAPIQHNIEGQAGLMSANASRQVQEEQRQLREAVVQKDEAVFYEQHHDAKEEGRNKYVNLYGKKKKTGESQQEKPEQTVNRINFDLKI